MRITVLYRMEPCGLVKGMFIRRDRSWVKIINVCRSAVGLTDIVRESVSSIVGIPLCFVMKSRLKDKTILFLYFADLASCYDSW